MIKSYICNLISQFLTGYNHEKYWDYHFKYENPQTPYILRKYYWLKLNRIEGKNNSFIGHFNFGDCPHFANCPTLPHQLHGIHISNNAKVGKNVVIYQNVTIGVKSNTDYSAPTIGNNVTICAGAVVIGNVTIGNNVTIGANAVVVKDIPSDCIAVGNPARIIQN